MSKVIFDNPYPGDGRAIRLGLQRAKNCLKEAAVFLKGSSK